MGRRLAGSGRVRWVSGSVSEGSCCDHYPYDRTLSDHVGGWPRGVTRSGLAGPPTTSARTALGDTVGHDHADEMLREMAVRLSATVRDNDFVGRLGGDEFVVIAEGLADLEEVASLGLRFLDAISRPLPGPESTVVTASIGIAPVRSNFVEAREVVRDSDSAMYAAKRAGRDRCALFEGGQHVRTGRRLQMARALRGAEVRGELRLVFQPVLALPDLNVVGVEALLRWTSPTFGEVSPVEFIPVADDTGTIVPIGAWVLRRAARRWLSCRTWRTLWCST